MDAALDAATSALLSQGKALSIISDNLANSSTTGYKAVDTSFADLVTGETTTTTATTGGVSAAPQQDVGYQGLISGTNTSTNMAIDGNGMFVVADQATGQKSYYYTRDGNFTTDANGYLVENGYYLLGWPTDKNGTITASNESNVDALQPVNVSNYGSKAVATQNVSLAWNLPADATAGATYTESIELYDSLGAKQDVPVTFTKSSTVNEWNLTVGNPQDPATASTSGTVGGTTSYTVDFNTDGSLGGISYTDSSGATVNTTSATVTIAGWNDGADTATDGNIALNLGTVGKTNGLTQYSTGSASPAISITSTSQDGLPYGSLSSVSVAADGTVTGTYTNGQNVALYKVPVATFANENGLAPKSDNMYEDTSASGSYTLRIAGQGGSGSIDGSSLEGSTTDTSTEFTKMIKAQQAYSASTQIITADKAMFQSLITAVG